MFFFFFSSRRRHTRCLSDWSSDVCSSDLYVMAGLQYTVQITIVAAIGGTFFGTLLAMARLSAIKPLALGAAGYVNLRSEEHTSELQSLRHLVCRLLLEKKKDTTYQKKSRD